MISNSQVKQIDNQTGTMMGTKLGTKLQQMQKAMGGDIVFVVTPATTGKPATAEAWTRDVLVEVQSADGEVHDWLNIAIATGVSISDDSTAGTAEIDSTTLTLVDGTAIITVTGDAAAWLEGEKDTLTVAEATILGYTIATKASEETFTA